MQVAVSKQRVAAGAQRGAGLTEALGLPTLATMSAVWGNPENIYSLRVLPPVTRSGSRARHHSITSLALISLFPRSGLRAWSCRLPQTDQPVARNVPCTRCQAG